MEEISPGHNRLLHPPVLRLPDSRPGSASTHLKTDQDRPQPHSQSPCGPGCRGNGWGRPWENAEVSGLWVCESAPSGPEWLLGNRLLSHKNPKSNSNPRAQNQWAQFWGGSPMLTTDAKKLEAGTPHLAVHSCLLNTLWCPGHRREERMLCAQAGALRRLASKSRLELGLGVKFSQMIKHNDLIPETSPRRLG